MPAAFVFACCLSLTAGLVTLLLPDLATMGPVFAATRGGEIARAETGERADGDTPRLFDVLKKHRRVLLTVGTGAMVVALVRSARQVVLPLWATSLGADASTASLIFAVSTGIDLGLFFFGGLAIDKLGAIWVVVPSLVVMGLALLALPLSGDVKSLVAVAVVLGVGNGFSPGIVSTLGSIASPAYGRGQFLGGWRALTDTGLVAGPLVISALTALWSVAAACSGLGVIALAGSGWLAWALKREG
jgi:MFS family permease